VQLRRLLDQLDAGDVLTVNPIVLCRLTIL
jgi:hypothetical protein